MAESSIHHPFALNLLLTHLRKHWKPKLDLEALLTFFRLSEEGRPEDVVPVLKKSVPQIMEDISRLEGKLEVQLFNVDPEKPGYVRLTPVGEALFGHALQLLSLAFQAEEDIKLRGEGNKELS